jgi:hypothetical protein
VNAVGVRGLRAEDRCPAIRFDPHAAEAVLHGIRPRAGGGQDIGIRIFSLLHTVHTHKKACDRIFLH